MIERGKESNMNLYTKEGGEIGESDQIKRENVRVSVVLWYKNMTCNLILLVHCSFCFNPND
jgi:hypothetical protein